MKSLPRTERKCKWCNQQGLHFQNIQTAHTTQQQQNKRPDLKMAWKDAHHLSYYRNANQSHNEIPPHTGQDCLVTKWYLTLLPSRLLCPWDFSGKTTGVGCHFFLQGIFPIQGLNPCLLHWKVDSLPLSHQGSPLVRIAIFKKSTNNKRWRGCGEKRTLPHCWWECKLVQPLWQQYRGSSKN